MNTLVVPSTTFHLVYARSSKHQNCLVPNGLRHGSPASLSSRNQDQDTGLKSRQETKQIYRSAHKNDVTPFVHSRSMATVMRTNPRRGEGIDKLAGACHHARARQAYCQSMPFNKTEERQGSKPRFPPKHYLIQKKLVPPAHNLAIDQVVANRHTNRHAEPFDLSDPNTPLPAVPQTWMYCAKGQSPKLRPSAAALQNNSISGSMRPGPALAISSFTFSRFSSFFHLGSTCFLVLFPFDSVCFRE